MHDLGEPSTPFPWWIWIALGALLVGTLVIFLVKYQKPDDAQYRPYRGESRGRRRHRHRSRSSRGGRSGRHRSGGDVETD